MAIDLTFRIRNLKGDLESIEAELAKGEAAPETLQDFKSAVDSVRLSVWAVLTAAQSTDYQQAKIVVARFRTRRLAELCRNVLEDISKENIPADSPELEELEGVLSQAAGAVSDLIKSS